MTNWDDCDVFVRAVDICGEFIVDFDDEWVRDYVIEFREFGFGD